MRLIKDDTDTRTQRWGECCSDTDPLGHLSQLASTLLSLDEVLVRGLSIQVAVHKVAMKFN